jgi:hypothetical protein
VARPDTLNGKKAIVNLRWRQTPVADSVPATAADPVPATVEGPGDRVGVMRRGSSGSSSRRPCWAPLSSALASAAAARSSAAGRRRLRTLAQFLSRAQDPSGNSDPGYRLSRTRPAAKGSRSEFGKGCRHSSSNRRSRIRKYIRLVRPLCPRRMLRHSLPRHGIRRGRHQGRQDLMGTFSQTDRRRQRRPRNRSNSCQERSLRESGRSIQVLIRTLAPDPSQVTVRDLRDPELQGPR